MGRRQREWAHRTRERWKHELGGKCFRCGDASEFDKLEFHHIEPRTWSTKSTEQSQRIAFLRREIAAGVVKLACPKCNQELGEPPPPPGPEPEAPF